MPVAGVGYGARDACAARGRQRRGQRAGAPRPRMAEAAAGARYGRRLGGDAPRRAARRLGLPVRQSALSRSRRYRRRRHGHGPRLRHLPDAGADYGEAIARGREWIEGLQSKNGGWGAFDADNTYHYLNQIPFSDHGALLDPPTADVTARCVSMLAQLGDTRGASPALDRGIDYLHAHAGEGGKLVRPLGHELHLRDLVGAVRLQRGRRRSASSAAVRKAVAGSSPSRTPTAAGARTARATSSTTKATSRRRARPRRRRGRCLGLMAAGEIDHPAVERGIDYLTTHAGHGRLLDGRALHRDGIPARVLSALSRLCEVLPALGAGALLAISKAANARTVSVGM